MNNKGTYIRQTLKDRANFEYFLLIEIALAFCFELLTKPLKKKGSATVMPSPVVV